MSEIVMSKIVKIVSTGRFAVGKWIAVGPQKCFAKKPVSEIKQMLEKYPDVKIVERADSGRLIYLNLSNYNKNNDLEKTFIAGGTDSNAIEAPSKDQASTIPEKKPETKSYDDKNHKNNWQHNNKHNSGNFNKGNESQKNNQQNQVQSQNQVPTTTVDSSTESTAVIPDEI